MSTGTVVENRNLIDWTLVSAVLLPQRHGTPGVKHACANPWCNREASDGYSLCPYCRIHGRGDLSLIYEASINSAPGCDRVGRALPVDSEDFVSGLANLAKARGFEVVGEAPSSDVLSAAAWVFSHIHVSADLLARKPAATATTKRRNSSTGKPGFRSDLDAVTERIPKARPRLEEEEKEAGVVDKLAAVKEAEKEAAELVMEKLQDDGIRPGIKVAEAPAPTEEAHLPIRDVSQLFDVPPETEVAVDKMLKEGILPEPAEPEKFAIETAKTAKPAPVTPQIIAGVEYEQGWPDVWSISGNSFVVDPDAQYAAICQAKDCGKHFVARGGVVHGLREAHRPALCPDHRYCKCGQLAVDVFHAKGVPGLELADGQPVCWECRGRLIQRQKAALKELLEPCPNLGQEGCYGRKRADRDESGKPLFDVCAGCKKIGRTATVNGKAVREEGQVVTPSMVPSNPALATTTATVTATAAA